MKKVLFAFILSVLLVTAILMAVRAEPNYCTTPIPAGEMWVEFNRTVGVFASIPGAPWQAYQTFGQVEIWDVTANNKTSYPLNWYGASNGTGYQLVYYWYMDWTPAMGGTKDPRHTYVVTDAWITYLAGYGVKHGCNLPVAGWHPSKFDYLPMICVNCPEFTEAYPPPH